MLLRIASNYASSIRNSTLLYTWKYALYDGTHIHTGHGHQSVGALPSRQVQRSHSPDGESLEFVVSFINHRSSNDLALSPLPAMLYYSTVLPDILWDCIHLPF